MTQKTILIVCNSHANRGKAAGITRQLQTAARILPQVEWKETQYHGHATTLAHEASGQGYERVIAMGGDGTIHEVVNGLMTLPEEKRPVLGIIPAGSGNDFAYSLNIPDSPIQALSVALSSPPRPIDVARIRDDSSHSEYWVNTLGIGFDARVNINSRKIQWTRGFLVYFIAALQTILFNHTPQQFKANQDGKNWEKLLLMLTICNGKREGGAFKIAPQARTDDDRLNLIAIDTISRLAMLWTIPFMLTGTHKRLNYVHMDQFQHLELESDHPMMIHCDGEIYAGLDTTLHKLAIEVCPGAILAAVPDR